MLFHVRFFLFYAFVCGAKSGANKYWLIDIDWLTRFKDIAAFVPYPISSLPKIFPRSPGSMLDRLFTAKKEGVGLIVCAISF